MDPNTLALRHCLLAAFQQLPAKVLPPTIDDAWASTPGLTAAGLGLSWDALRLQLVVADPVAPPIEIARDTHDGAVDRLSVYAPDPLSGAAGLSFGLTLNLDRAGGEREEEVIPAIDDSGVLWLIQGGADRRLGMVLTTRGLAARFQTPFATERDLAEARRRALLLLDQLLRAQP
jgi:hypothetical protein